MFGSVKFLVKPKNVDKAVKILPVNRVIESRMALKLDDLIGKKKEVNQVLDLSKSTVNNAEEFKKLVEKVPEYRIKPEKIRPEDIKIQDKDSKRHKKKKFAKYKLGEYQFADPVPEEMRGVKLEDLCPVNIQWNMLTTLRPKNKADTEYFSRSYIATKSQPPVYTPPKYPNFPRLVELGKLALSTQEKEKKTPDVHFLKKMKNRAGVQESRFLSCNECGEDFCQKETCMMFQYENFKREPVVESVGKKEEGSSRRGRPLTKGKKKRSKSSKKASTKDKSESPGKKGRKSKSKSNSRSRSRSKAGKGESSVVKPTGKKGKGSPVKRPPRKSPNKGSS